MTPEEIALLKAEDPEVHSCIAGYEQELLYIHSELHLCLSITAAVLNTLKRSSCHLLKSNYIRWHLNKPAGVVMTNH